MQKTNYAWRKNLVYNPIAVGLWAILLGQKNKKEGVSFGFIDWSRLN